MPFYLGTKRSLNLNKSKFCPQAKAFFDRWVTSPTSIDGVRYNALISGLVNSGLWDDVGVFWINGTAPDEQVALLDWKNVANLTKQGTLTFDSGGYASNGSTGYLSTGIPPASVPGLLQDSNHIGAWGTGTTGTSYPIGRETGSGNFSLAINTSSNLQMRLASSANTFFFADTIQNGHVVGTRRGAATSEVYRNGVSIQTSAITSAGLGTGNIELLRTSSGLYSNSGFKLRAAHLGTQLSATKEAILYELLSTFFTAGGL